MKCFAAVALLALFSVALAAPEKPVEVEKIEPVNAELEPEAAAARDKRGVLVGAAYTAPVAYTAYAAPVAYSGAYSVPYAYSAYRSYPYYYSSPYIVG